MKKIIIVGFVLIYLLACEKDDNQPELKYLNHIFAGKTEGIGVRS